jgi:hypothetical protein
VVRLPMPRVVLSDMPDVRMSVVAPFAGYLADRLTDAAAE